jgi:hypothetical protein
MSDIEAHSTAHGRRDTKCRPIVSSGANLAIHRVRLPSSHRGLISYYGEHKRVYISFRHPPLEKGDRGGFFRGLSNPPTPPFAKGG